MTITLSAVQIFLGDTSTLVAEATAGSIPIDGTGWVLLERHGTSPAWYYGTGTTTDPPASWTPIAVASVTTLYDRLAVALGEYGADEPILDVGPVLVLDEEPAL